MLNLNGQNEELHWQVAMIEPKLNTIFSQLKSSDVVPKVLAEWWTCVEKTMIKKSPVCCLRNSGYTLIELMLVLAIVSVVLLSAQRPLLEIKRITSQE